MTNIDLESLPYPMFTTTEEEKECLRAVSHNLNGSKYFLCNLVIACSMWGLVDKIVHSLEGNSHLSGYLDYYPDNHDDMAEMRRIWIRKLLEYTGE